MRILVLALSLMLFFSFSSYAQFGGFLDKVKEKVEQKVEDKVDQKVDETIDKALDGDQSKENKSNDAEQQEQSKDNNASSKESSNKNDNATTKAPETEVKQTENKPADIKSYSKNDFVQGEKVLFFDDFAMDNVGDFPVKWTTNGSGEVRTVDGQQGKWFSLKDFSTFVPEFFPKEFPENFTVEFDILTQKSDNYGAFIFLDIMNSENKLMIGQSEVIPLYNEGGSIGFQFDSDEASYFTYKNCVLDENSTTPNIDSRLADNVLKGKANQVVHIGLMINKSRMRIYCNEKKVVDVPKFFSRNKPLRQFQIRTNHWGEEGTYTILLKNFRYAEGKADVRSKLLTEGKLVTHGILFDYGSDKVKPESFGAIKEIADVLKENPTVKVNIVGHTDSDGDAAFNLELSKKRAASVKKVLIDEFKIDGSRMTSDGKGASQPVAPNKTPEDKANNRRVEFIKI